MRHFAYALYVVGAVVVIVRPELWPVAATYGFLALVLRGVQVLNRWAAEQSERIDE